jgi:O-antigen/teichoic acid export membrane protein
MWSWRGTQFRKGDEPNLKAVTKRAILAVASQGLASATYFALILGVGRVSGPRGLGALSVVLTGYFITLGLFRALLVEPLIAVTAGTTDGESNRATLGNLRLTFIFSAFVSVGVECAAIPLAATRPTVLTLTLLASPVAVIPALSMNYLRAVAFRDGAAGTALWADTVAAAIFGLLAPAAVLGRAPWVFLVCWGAAMLAAVLSIYREYFRRVGGAVSDWRHWIDRQWPLGAALAADYSVFAVSTYLIIFLVAWHIGNNAAGGLRAVESLFAPLTVLLPAVNLILLPRLAECAKVRAVRKARKIAVWSGVTLASLTVFYAAAIRALPHALATVFGSAFAQYTNLVIPVVLAQVVTALAAPQSLLLVAEGRRRELIGVRLFTASISIGTAIALILWFGLLGAAYAMLCGAAAAFVSASWAVRRTVDATSAKAVSTALRSDVAEYGRGQLPASGSLPLRTGNAGEDYAG